MLRVCCITRPHLPLVIEQLCRYMCKVKRKTTDHFYCPVCGLSVVVVEEHCIGSNNKTSSHVWPSIFCIWRQVLCILHSAIFTSMQFVFIAAKSTFFSRLVFNKLTLYCVMRDKTVVKDLLCAVYISILDG